MTHLIQRIHSRRLPCYFISPHLDDAALSVGSLIKYLAKRTPVTVINVFTKGQDFAATLSAQKFVRLSGYASAGSLFAARAFEDGRILGSLGAKVINLGLTDALWRQKTHLTLVEKIGSRWLPEFSHLYPVYRWHILSGRPAAGDQPLIASLAKALVEVIPSSSPSAVFCPLGVGGHVDHWVTRLAVEKLCRPIYWQDQPYSQRAARPVFPIPAGYQAVVFPANQTSKRRLLRRYKSQINQLFPLGKIPHLEEKLFYPHA